MLLPLLGFGCREPEPHPHRPDDPFVAGLGGSAETYRSLDEIALRFGVLRRSMGAEEAREALVAEVRSGLGDAVDGALSPDGYTVSVLLRDGVRGSVITDEDLDGAAGGARRRASTAAGPTPRLPRGPAADGCDPGVACPTSHHVRVFDATSVTNPGATSATQELIDDLYALGWTEADVELVQRSERGELLDPDRLLDLRGEGLVVYVAHGGVWSIAESGYPDEHYFQVTSAGDYTGVTDPERNALLEAYDGTLITAASIPIRDPETNQYTDVTAREALFSPRLFAEAGLVDPGTMMLVVSCNSANVSSDLLDMGLASVMTWEGKTSIDEARDAQRALLGHLVDGASAEEARASLTEAEATTPAGAVARLETAGPPSYLPAWGELTVDPAGLPAGTDHLELVIPRDGEPLVVTDLRPGAAVPIDGVPPVPLQVTVRAVDAAGRLLASTTHALDLDPGSGNAVTLSEGADFGLTLSAAPSSVAADGVAAATVTAAVRAWRDVDVREPTGAALVCVDVALDTDLGTWATPATGRTGGAGTFAADLVSDAAGTAEVHGLLPAEGVEATRPATVHFGTSEARTGVIFPDGNPYVLPTLEYAYDSVFVIDEDGNELCWGTWSAEAIRSVPCAACDRAWSLGDFSGFREHGGSCAPFGYAEGAAQGAVRYGVAAALDQGDETLLDVLLGYDPDEGRWVPIGTATFAPRVVDEVSWDAWDYVTDWGAAPWL